MSSGKRQVRASVYRRINQPQSAARRPGLRDNIPMLLAVGGGTLMASCLLGLMLTVRLLPGYGAGERDIQGAPMQTGVATVVSKTSVYRPSRYSVDAATFTFTFHLRDQTVAFVGQNDLRSALTREGDTVSVTYKTGKSGTYYIQDWNPPVAMSR